MASFRRGAVCASRLAKQVITVSRSTSKRLTLQQARVAACLPATMVHRNISDSSLLKKCNHHQFSSFPKITTSVLLSTISPGGEGPVDTGSSSGASELESCGGDDEGLVTPAADPMEDL